MLGEQDLTVTRTAAGSHVDGVWIDGAESDIPDVVGTVRPLNDRERRFFGDEGSERSSQRVKLYTETELQVANPDDNVRGDVFVSIEGQHHIIGVENSKVDGFSCAHFKYFADREGDT